MGNIKMGCPMCLNVVVPDDQRVRINEILEYWFMDLKGQKRKHYQEEFIDRWHGTGAEKELYVRVQFFGDYNRYLAGEYSSWNYDRDGRLAAIILLDQFSRVFFRHKPEMYEQDAQALKLAMKVINS